ncbi:MAG: RAD55 family ATPase [Candidatus Parvarchaeota archaeon]|nr:RAD55 family ATPase [Candidatus Parvarchaeota archaeon]
MDSLAVGIDSFDKVVGGIPMHRNYLLNGSKESGKDLFAYHLTLSALANKVGVIYITSSKSASDLLSSFSLRNINISQYLGNSLKIVDNFIRNIQPDAKDNAYTRVLNGPLDLTGLAVAVSSLNSDFIKDGKTTINIFDSVSSLLLSNNSNTIFRFLQFICGKSKISGVTSLFLIDSDMHPPDINETIKSLMDGVINLKLENGVRYFTFTGTEKEVLNWTQL